MKIVRLLALSALLSAAALSAGCAEVIDVSDDTEALATAICIDTIDCGGMCGTMGEVRAWLAQCIADNSGGAATGPCFSDCWSTCALVAEHSPRLIACTLECMTADCPAAAAGLVMAGLSECPVPDPDAICIALYAPVTCGDCTYSNSCWAAAAGLAPESCTSDGFTAL